MPRTHTLDTKTKIQPWIPNDLYARMGAKMADRATKTNSPRAKSESVPLGLSAAVTEALEMWLARPTPAEEFAQTGDVQALLDRI